MSGLAQLDDLLAVISRALIRSRVYGLWPDDQRLGTLAGGLQYLGCNTHWVKAR